MVASGSGEYGCTRGIGAIDMHACTYEVQGLVQGEAARYVEATTAQGDVAVRRCGQDRRVKVPEDLRCSDAVHDNAGKLRVGSYGRP